MKIVGQNEMDQTKDTPKQTKNHVGRTQNQ